MNDLFQLMVVVLKPTIQIQQCYALCMDSMLILAASSGKNLELLNGLAKHSMQKESTRKYRFNDTSLASIYA